MITKKKVLLSILLVIVIGIMFAVFICYSPIQADKYIQIVISTFHALLIKNYSRKDQMQFLWITWK